VDNSINLKEIFRKYSSGIYSKVVKLERELSLSQILKSRKNREHRLKVLNKFTKHYLNYHRETIHRRKICKSLYCSAYAVEECVFTNYYNQSLNF